MSTITFYCDENDDPIEIWLEPYETNFDVQPGNEITFEGKYPDRDFKWIVRMGAVPGNIILRAERMDGKINVYDNDVLIEQW